ncbi:DUF222 domain-containing protein [Brevibacterium sp.]|uniref:DUF222 domain-containing protein n=1 Tax=Brevibacterium sp. TaxID=1701 RepID=UPI002811DA13|nr:DUF222 domain-containing protein [Brevibacterium sp.]
MTLTPDRNHPKQNRRTPSAASPWCAGGNNPKTTEPGGAEPGVSGVSRVPDPPDALAPREVSPETSEAGSCSGAGSSAGADSSLGQWGGRTLWEATVDDPAAQAEARRISAERDAEIRARQDAIDQAREHAADLAREAGTGAWGKSEREAAGGPPAETPVSEAGAGPDADVAAAGESRSAPGSGDEFAGTAVWGVAPRGHHGDDEIPVSEVNTDAQAGADATTGIQPETGGGAETRIDVDPGGTGVDHPSSSEAEPDADADAVGAGPHPLLSEEAWADLVRFAPEITDSITALQTLVEGLFSFARPMGPDQAVTMLDGVEALERLVESLSVVGVSVFERSGTPRDYGAKDARALIEDRLHVSGYEASRRANLAKSLGNRVEISGQSREPEFPQVAAGLRCGRLSANQASVIAECLRKLPGWVSGEQRVEAERVLVENAPAVRVRDIRLLFEEVLAWIDPDGSVPDEEPRAEEYCVNLRARKDGAWVLKGLLDPTTGGIMHGLLTSRITTDPEAGSTTTDGENDKTDAEEVGTDADGADVSVGSAADGATAGSAADGEASSGGDESLDAAVVEAFEAVLSGDRHDVLDPTVGGESATGVPGYGVREDGTRVAMTLQQPGIRTRIYSRFATLVSRVEMNRVGAGAPFALVVTAKASDLAAGSGRAETGAESRFPMATAVREGLNGAVFFHLMSEKARTVEVCTEKRFANAKQLAILTARDQGCTFPGCDTPPGWCDAHHIVEWAQGGKTDINNMTLACGVHHRLLDKSGWETVMLVDGRPAWVPPATLDPARRPILHARFEARDIAETLFD